MFSSQFLRFFKRRFRVILLPDVLITEVECRTCCTLKHPFGAISLWCYLYLDQKWTEYSPGHKIRSYCPKEPAVLNNQGTKRMHYNHPRKKYISF